MPRYVFQIKTGDVFQGGTDANVSLGLNGLDASMKPVQITDPSTINDWERGDTNTGVIETEDLGELQTGQLSHDDTKAGSGWYVDWVKITSEEDGREWTATVGRWDEGGRFPMLRFTRTDDGNYAQVQRQKAQKAAADKARAAAEQRKRDSEDEAARQAEEDEAAKAEQARVDADLDRELRAARAEKERARKKAEIDRIKAGASGTGSGSGTPAPNTNVRTYELYAIVNGRNAPLSAGVSGGRVVPGARIMVGETAADGYGLSGVPGMWPTLYPGISPSAYGLDADKAVLGSDGSRGWVLTASFLQGLLGPGWRGIVY